LKINDFFMERDYISYLWKHVVLFKKYMHTSENQFCCFDFQLN